MDDPALRSWSSEIKRFSAHKFWEGGSHAIRLDDNEKRAQRFNYLHNNPVASGIVGFPEHYLLSSAGDYEGVKGSVNIERTS